MWNMFCVLYAKVPTTLTFCRRDPSYTALPLLIKPSKKQKLTREDSFEGQGVIMQAEEWIRRLRNIARNNGNNEEMIEGSLVSNIIQPRSPPLLEHNNSADMACEHSGAESSPLGLRLNKAELLKVIHKEFSQDSRAKGRYEPTVTSLNVSVPQPSVTMLPLKPSKFHAHILRIGTWQWASTYDGDLVAKFYYANNKLVWEILDSGLKRKIEINWENISALNVTCPDGGPGTLEIMRPRFFIETNQQPGKTTMWIGTKDFTGGQASIHRRHVLHCAAEILNKHIVKLLSSNHRLYKLSQEGNMVQNYPYFEQRHPESQVPESSNANNLYHCHGYQRFWGQKFGETTLNPRSVPASGRSLVATGVASGGFQQFSETVPMSMSIGTNVTWRNQNGLLDGMPMLNRCSDLGHSTAVTGGPSGGLEQHRNMVNWRRVSVETLREAQLNFSSGRVHVFTESTTSGGLQQSSNMFNSNYSDGSSSRSSMGELELSHYVFNDDTTTHSLKQNVVNSATMDDAMVLEKISHDLLDDIDMEMKPTGAAEDDILMSTINSLSSLIQPQEVDPDAGSSGAGGGN